ncbi:hypothetical protein NLJ89_g2290 [Agrocybe chaxingu]|uniref:NmrA-like domain-containing protein n=1 Tax=Agrocybe chaxingu TaxID=84603 RepID=A0A9W8K7M5_9AGAR|nr:hypothetical protein NLJ89_g2290 [Agrocybe chaxingu]
MSSKVKVFMTGVTGYIGGSVLSRLLRHPDAPSFSITVLVRSEEKANKLKDFGVNPVLGSIKDVALLEELSSRADILISLADSDDLAMGQAMLRGLKRRYAATDSVPILIQTSGTGVLADGSAGDYSSDVIYNDDDPNQIETLADTQQHRYLDLALVQGDEEGYVRVYFILPSNIYGLATGNLVDAGIQNPRSIQIPSIINASLGRGRGGIVGAGKNIWNDVHIDDVADLYVALYDSIKTNPKGTGHGREGFYIAENGEHTMYQIGKAIAEDLVARGKATNPEPSTFTGEEINIYFGASLPFRMLAIVVSQRLPGIDFLGYEFSRQV